MQLKINHIIEDFIFVISVVKLTFTSYFLTALFTVTFKFFKLLAHIIYVLIGCLARACKLQKKLHSTLYSFLYVRL